MKKPFPFGAFGSVRRARGLFDRWKIALCWVGFGISAASAPCFAQYAGAGVDLRFDTLLKQQDRNKTTPGNEFGDQHSLESGSLSFNVVDVAISGNNNLTVEFRRTLLATDSRKSVNQGAWGYPADRLGDWSPVLPRIEGTYDVLAGWITSDSTRPTKNCSVALASQVIPPPGVEYPQIFRAHMFWNPPTVHYPDGSSGLLTYNDNQGLPVPPAGGPYFWVTASHDVASCIPTLKNVNSASADAEERRFGQGEGYLVTRPDGTRYWFDWMALVSKLPSYSTALFCGSVELNGCTSQPYAVVLQQATLALYPTRVEDRFGNWVTYSYSNKANEAIKLDRIQSSDGRVIDIGYVSGYVRTVAANGRTWTYIYDDNPDAVPGFQPLMPARLTEVRNPDSSSWKYSGISHPYSPPPSISWPCDDLAWMSTVNPDTTAASDTDFTGYTVESPSGARAVFRVGVVLLGRSAVPASCYQSGAGSPGDVRQPLAPRYFLGGYRYALTGKKVTGPGLTPAVWKYHYQSDIGFAPMSPGTSRTKVLNPDGVLDIYTFGNTYGVDEGLLLAHTRSANQQIVLSEANTYVVGLPVTGGFPRLVGFYPYALDRAPSTLLRPKLNSTKVVQSTVFKWEVNSNCGSTGAAICLDELARPIRVTKSSSAASLPPSSPPIPAAPTVTAPSSLTAGAQYLASWSTVSGVTQYVVERSHNSGAYGVVYDGVGASVSLSASQAGTLTHRAKACNTSGCSAYSAVATTNVTSPPLSIPPAPVVTAPGTLTAGNQYQVSWSASSGATQYVLERSRNGSAYSVLYDGSGTSATLSAGVAGSFAHRVKACNTAGCSAYSAIATTTVAPREGTGTCVPGEPCTIEP